MMRRTKLRKPLSLLLALALVASMFVATGVTAFAGTGYPINCNNAGAWTGQDTAVNAVGGDTIEISNYNRRADATVNYWNDQTLTVEYGGIASLVVPSGYEVDTVTAEGMTVTITLKASGNSVSIGTVTGGTVSADKTSSVASGATVTLTATPSAGYELDTLAVKDAEDNEVATTQDPTDATKYTFTMPAKAVTVSATFKSSGGSSSGTGTTEVETSSVEVIYDKDCSWTATYPTSVTVPTGGEGDALSADISFNVKGLIDTDHVVTITPTDSTVTLTGERHSGTITGVAITGGTAAAGDVNTEAGATVTGSVSLTVPTGLAVDKYAAKTTFKIQCAKPAVETYTVTVMNEIGYDTKTLTVDEGTAWSVSTIGETLTIGDNTYKGSDFTSAFAYWRLNTTILSGNDSGTITEDSTFTAVSGGF